MPPHSNKMKVNSYFYANEFFWHTVAELWEGSNYFVVRRREKDKEESYHVCSLQELRLILCESESEEIYSRRQLKHAFDDKPARGKDEIVSILPQLVSSNEKAWEAFMASIDIYKRKKALHEIKAEHDHELDVPRALRQYVSVLVQSHADVLRDRIVVAGEITSPRPKRSNDDDISERSSSEEPVRKKMKKKEEEPVRKKIKEEPSAESSLPPPKTRVSAETLWDQAMQSASSSTVTAKGAPCTSSQYPSSAGT